MHLVKHGECSMHMAAKATRESSLSYRLLACLTPHIPPRNQADRGTEPICIPARVCIAVPLSYSGKMDPISRRMVG